MGELDRSDACAHKLSMEARRALDVRGVREVCSFDEQIVVLDTVCGGMTIEGMDLHIHVLDTEAGIVSLNGRVDSISYFENEATRDTGFFKKLF